MSWAKLSGGYAFHRKVLEVGNEGVGAHARMIAFAAEALTGGKISQAVALSIAPQGLIDRLVAVTLLDRDGSDYIVHDFGDYNPSGAELSQRRADLKEKRRQAGRKGLDVRWGQHGNNGKSDGKLPSSLPSESDGKSHGKVMATSSSSSSSSSSSDVPVGRERTPSAQAVQGAQPAAETRAGETTKWPGIVERFFKNPPASLERSPITKRRRHTPDEIEETRARTDVKPGNGAVTLVTPGAKTALPETFALTPESAEAAAMGGVTDVPSVFRKFQLVAKEKSWTFNVEGWNARWEHFWRDELQYQRRERERTRGSGNGNTRTPDDGVDYAAAKRVKAAQEQDRLAYEARIEREADEGAKRAAARQQQ